MSNSGEMSVCWMPIWVRWVALRLTVCGWVKILDALSSLMLMLL